MAIGGDAMRKTLHCTLCGKQKFDAKAFDAKAFDSQDFYVCWNCSLFWFTDYWFAGYVRRLKSRALARLPWNRI
jgi:hypothetical protein